MVFPSHAYAITYIGGPYESAQAAALGYLGYDVDDMPSEVITWLSYSTADGGTGTADLPNYPDYAIFRASLDHSVTDVTRWYSSHDGYMLSSTADAARADVRSALIYYGAYEAAQSAGNAGSGSGSGSDGGNKPSYICDLTAMYSNSTSTNIYQRVREYTYDSTTEEITIGSIVKYITSKPADNSSDVIYTHDIKLRGNSSFIDMVNGYLSTGHDAIFLKSLQTGYLYMYFPLANEYTLNIQSNGSYIYSANARYPYVAQDTYTFMDSDGIFTYATIGNTSGTSISDTFNAGWVGVVSAGTVVGGGGSTPVVPPTHWPDSPTVVTPTTPTVDLPTNTNPPTEPTVTSDPAYPAQVTYPDVTYVTADLYAVLDALNEHCEHLQNAIYNAASNVVSSLRSTLHNEFATTRSFLNALMLWQTDEIGAYFDSLLDYLDDFAAWLDSRLDLSTLRYLLLRIYSVLGEIKADMANLDRSTGDLVSLTTIESGLSDLVADVELITQSLTNLQDNNLLLTVRGYLKGIYDDLEAWDSYPVTDLSTLETSVGDIYDEISAWTNDFTTFWNDLDDYLDSILYDLEHLELTPHSHFDPSNPPMPEPDSETGIVNWEEQLNITALRDAVTRLMTKFPFASINNFVLILTALVRPAVAPQFDLPMPNPSDWSRPYSVHVDLSIWDVPAAILRTGIMLWSIARVSRRTVALWTREEGGGDA